MPKGLPPYVSVAASLVPVGVSNRYQWKPKAPVEKTRCLKARPLVAVAGHRLGNRFLWPFSAGAEDMFSSSESYISDIE